MSRPRSTPPMSRHEQVTALYVAACKLEYRGDIVTADLFKRAAAAIQTGERYLDDIEIVESCLVTKSNT